MRTQSFRLSVTCDGTDCHNVLNFEGLHGYQVDKKIQRLGWRHYGPQKRPRWVAAVTATNAGVDLCDVCVAHGRKRS
jgi:hypothetical protein